MHRARAGSSLLGLVPHSLLPSEKRIFVLLSYLIHGQCAQSSSVSIQRFTDEHIPLILHFFQNKQIPFNKNHLSPTIFRKGIDTEIKPGDCYYSHR
ncbi:unnamed protein product [Allacma fusca]|uniref:Uncharacterized protein n=1 Tax=Allacma fusca TaxID=39272 RepID=A0A8J2KAC5_9HEXA|nr:unnamed protein product [Allacma fusca]